MLCPDSFTLYLAPWQVQTEEWIHLDPCLYIIIKTPLVDLSTRQLDPSDHSGIQISVHKSRSGSLFVWSEQSQGSPISFKKKQNFLLDRKTENHMQTYLVFYRYSEFLLYDIAVERLQDFPIFKR